MQTYRRISNQIAICICDFFSFGVSECASLCGGWRSNSVSATLSYTLDGAYLWPGRRMATVLTA